MDVFVSVCVYVPVGVGVWVSLCFCAGVTSLRSLFLVPCILVGCRVVFCVCVCVSAYLYRSMQTLFDFITRGKYLGQMRWKKTRQNSKIREERRLFYCLALKNREEIRKWMGENIGNVGPNIYLCFIRAKIIH